MPFRQAHYWVLALIALTVIGFWPTYFAVLRASPWGFHLHGITATLWLLLLAAQSWSAHGQRFALHRRYGLASLGLFPLFFAGMVAVVLGMAQATAAGSPFYAMYGARLALMDIPSVGLVGYLYYRALADRRHVQLHTRWMLATPLPLVVPILGRVVGHLTPGLTIAGPQDFHLFAVSVRIASGIALVLAWWLYRTAPRHGRPFVVTGLVILAQAMMFETVGFSAAWRAMFAALAGVPSVPLLLVAVVVGAAIDWFGWRAGRRASA